MDPPSSPNVREPKAKASGLFSFLETAEWDSGKVNIACY